MVKMLNSPVRIGVALALLFAVVKMGFYLYEPMPVSVSPAVMTNIFLLLSAVFLALYQAKKMESEESNALNDIKIGMKAGLPYTVLVAGFLYLFYAQINPEYNRHQIAEASVVIEKMVNDPKELARLKELNADFEIKTKEEIQQTLMKNPKSMFSAGATSTLALLGMLLLSTLYSILVAIIFRTLLKNKLV